ncbi:hypothetical protein F444_22461 [Phytophthora nicotianae P1976]|uniref:Uncharacterized protein n=1 Tax=Phytophthora nicotianae P1976 TaxID=1317066 RepID=A0A080YXQ3_PHYNI|nr:hypothetical protein F444_22461 [Phytophthora nicotianae P1976]
MVPPPSEKCYGLVRWLSFKETILLSLAPVRLTDKVHGTGLKPGTLPNHAGFSRCTRLPTPLYRD